jgi:hypothetical protein
MKWRFFWLQHTVDPAAVLAISRRPAQGTVSSARPHIAAIRGATARP